MRIALFTALMGLGLASTPAFAGKNTVKVGDLDATVLPVRLDYQAGKQQLFVEGKKVTGSRHKQLDYLGALFADEDGVVPASLQLEERHRALKRQNTGVGLVMGAPWVAMAVFAAVPPLYPVLLPVGAATLGTQVGGYGLMTPAKKAFDAEGLADDVALLHTLRFAENELHDNS